MLCLNADKTKYLIICPRQRKCDQTYQYLTINEYEIAIKTRVETINL